MRPPPREEGRITIRQRINEWIDQSYCQSSNRYFNCLSSWRYWLDDSKGIRPEKSWVLICWWWRLEQSLTRSRSSCCHYCHLATWIELNTSQKFLFLPPPSSLAPAKSTVTVWLSGTTAYPYCPGNWKRVDTCYYSFLVQLGTEGWVGLQSIRRAQFLGSASNERPLIES